MTGLLPPRPRPRPKPTPTQPSDPVMGVTTTDDTRDGGGQW